MAEGGYDGGPRLNEKEDDYADDDDIQMNEFSNQLPTVNEGKEADTSFSSTVVLNPFESQIRDNAVDYFYETLGYEPSNKDYEVFEYIDTQLKKQTKTKQNGEIIRLSKLKGKIICFNIKSVDYWIGYYNVRKRHKILRQIMNRDGETTETFQFIEPGLYNIKQIIDIIRESTSWVELSVNEKSGTITLLQKKERKKERKKITSSAGIANLLGLPSGLLSMGTYEGRIDLQSLTNIYSLRSNFHQRKFLQR